MKRVFFVVSLLMSCLLAPVVHAETKPATPVKEWTLLLFLNGNNNLNRFARANLIDIEKVGSSDQINVVTQWADIEYRKTQRLYVTKSNDPSQVTSPIVQELDPKIDMGDWHTLAEFIRWGVANYPARHYFIVVWDHGTGWHDLKAVRVGDISNDEKTGHWITTRELGWAMDEAARVMGHKVDLYGSDACEMAMVEVATELADSTELYLGSEENIPVDGWPYSRFLAKWMASPTMSAREVAGLVHEEFLRYFLEAGKGLRKNLKPATFSLYDLNATPELLKAISEFSKELGKLSGADLAKANEALIQSLTITVDYNDLLDFADELKQAGLKNFDLRTIDNLRSAAASYVLLNGATQPWEAKAKGISIWLPSLRRWYDKYLTQYQTLKFSKATSWEAGILPLQKKK